MFVLYVHLLTPNANVCRLFVFISVFGHVSVFLNLSISFFLLDAFLVIIGANKMYNQWLVNCSVCLCFIYLLQVNNTSICWACVSVLPWDLCVMLDVLFSSNKSFIQIIHSFMSDEFCRDGACAAVSI